MFLECDVSSSPREIDLEDIQTYIQLTTHVDFILMTTDAPQVENTPLAENDNSSAGNLGVKSIINENEGAPLVNEQEGLEENEAPPANDHEEDSQEENDEPRPMRRPEHERSAISYDYLVYMSEVINDMGKING
jgi:hypothetical protein